MPIYPFRRPNDQPNAPRQNDSQSEVSPTKAKLRRFKKFLIRWLKVSWTDILGIIVLDATAHRIYAAQLASTRTFPLTTSPSGALTSPYTELTYPNRGWLISPQVTGLVAALVPVTIICLAQLRIRSFWDFNNGILGLFYALTLGTLFQVIIKQLVGGFRPHFLAVCRPDPSLAAANNASGLNAVGFGASMYTSEICSNPDKADVQVAMTSFPSGHATAAFAGFVYLFLWMNAKLKVWANYRASIWWLALLACPLLAAVLQACALNIERSHHWWDILAGAAVGTAMAVASYRAMYAAVWDWRYNHIPLRRDRERDAVPEMTEGYGRRYVWIQKLGWGRRNRRRPGVKRVLEWTGLVLMRGPARLRRRRASAAHVRRNKSFQRAGGSNQGLGRDLGGEQQENRDGSGPNDAQHNDTGTGDEMV